jgi:ABC-2 type transport system permease protein
VERRAAAMNVIFVLWLREVKRYLRSRPQIIASLGQPLLYLLVLGFGLGATFRMSGQGSYLQFIAPGVIGMGILFTSIFSGMGLFWDRQFGFLKETLVAPVPRLQVMAGRTLGGATIAIIQGALVLVVCMIAGFRPQSWTAVPVALFFMALIAVVFAALGTAIGSSLKDMQAFQLIMNFLIMPIFFLSGALFPLANLPAALAVATRLDPLSYGIDGLRGAFIAQSHMGLAVDVGVLAVLASVFVMIGAWAFSKIQL